MYQLTVLTDLSMLPKAIDSNYEAVKTELQTVLKKYDGLVVTDENFKEMKATRAEINKGIGSIKMVGTEVKTRLLAPFLPFDAKVKELASLAEEKRNALDGQIKEIEARRRSEKNAAIVVRIGEELDKAGLSALKSHEHFTSLVSCHPNWLNETYSMKRVVAEIEGEVKRCADAYEQVRRIYADDAEVVKVKAEQFVASSGFDVGVVCERIKAFKAEEERLAEARRRDEERRAAKEREAAERAAREEAARLAAPVVEPVPAPVHAPATAPAACVAPPAVPADPMEAAKAALRAAREQTAPVEPAPAPVAPPPPALWKLSMSFTATMPKLAELKNFLEQNGIGYDLLGEPVRVREDVAQ